MPSVSHRFPLSQIHRQFTSTDTRTKPLSVVWSSWPPSAEGSNLLPSVPVYVLRVLAALPLDASLSACLLSACITPPARRLGGGSQLPQNLPPMEVHHEDPGPTTTPGLRYTMRGQLRTLCEHATGADPGGDRRRQVVVDEPASFGTWVGQRRQALHLTQEALRSGCSGPGHPAQMEADERRPSQELAERLAEVLAGAARASHDVRQSGARRAGAGPPCPLPPDPATAPPRVSIVASSQQSAPVQRCSFDRPRCRTGTDPRAAAARGCRPGDADRSWRNRAKPVWHSRSLPACCDDFADGVWFVNLAPIGDPALVVSTIAQVLGVKEARPAAAPGDLLTHISPGQSVAARAG